MTILSGKSNRDPTIKEHQKWSNNLWLFELEHSPHIIKLKKFDMNFVGTLFFAKFPIKVENFLMLSAKNRKIFHVSLMHHVSILYLDILEPKKKHQITCSIKSKSWNY
jgi:hypothetical protein